MWGVIRGGASLGALIAVIGMSAAVGSLHLGRSVFRFIKQVVKKKGE